MKTGQSLGGQRGKEGCSRGGAEVCGKGRGDKQITHETWDRHLRVIGDLGNLGSFEASTR